MGEDARWICHTCKTVCNRGGRPVFQSIQGEINTDDVKDFKQQVNEFAETFRFGDRDSMISFLDDLQSWLSRHEGHNIHIGSDYSTDLMDLDEYRNESVEGKVSDCTRYEVRCKSVGEWRQTSINEIKQTILRYTDRGVEISDVVDEVAAELYDKFSMKEI